MAWDAQNGPAETETPRDPLRPDPVLLGKHTLGSVTDRIDRLVLTEPTPRSWWGAFAVAFILVNVFLLAATWLLVRGVGIWGINIPVAWAWAIVNFVWWIGIGHAGTLISAILLLLHQDWRTSINRFAEAMTIFAVACAGMFPLLHLGRPWFFYWLLPYPNTMGLWPQFRSALVWDVFAVTTYLTVSLVFWYMGMIPDLASLRDRATNRLAQIVYGGLALGWRGEASHWQRYETLYWILAALATPLVVSVHTVVSFDFAITLLPGWHSTIFPPYFVAGAIFSGFAMVLTLAIPIRAVYGLSDLITVRHLENMGKLMLVTGLVVDYGYLMEAFMAWYSQNEFEQFSQLNRMLGPYWWVFAQVVFCNVLVPQLLWIRRVRRNPWLLFPIALLVNLGMWLERYMIIVVSLHRDFLPSSWGLYRGTIWDWATYLGTLGVFLFLFLLFLRFLPIIAAFEMRKLLPEVQEEPQ
jgi:Ni/Fe-hydrogenase subunit HybB-like protein